MHVENVSFPLLFLSVLPSNDRLRFISVDIEVYHASSPRVQRRSAQRVIFVIALLLSNISRAALLSEIILTATWS
jgi:hypothetical protein